MNTGETSLPYHSLKGPGFERLILNILVAEGKGVRFFGNSGQRDHGVDLVVEYGGTFLLYQCKNYAAEPSGNKITEELNKFKQEWLEEQGLPRPRKYVYCCPHSFSALKSAESWQRQKEQFREDTGVEVDLLTREILDEKLKRLPDIVADVFSDAHAEFFCRESTWQTEPWTRVTSRIDEQRAEVVRRFLRLHNDRSIYLDDELQQWFEDRAITENSLMLRGLPGSGKTTTTLEMAVSPAWSGRHIYYCSLKDGLDVTTVVASVRCRSHIPSFFILDDCHLDLTTVQRLLDRLYPELNSPAHHVRFILLGRHTPVEDEKNGIEHPLVEELGERDSCYTFPLSKEYLKKVVEYRREDLIDPASFVNLIRANGTLLELFRILEHATPTFATRLVNILDRKILDELIQKTIDSGRSIESLPYRSHLLSRLLSSDQPWRLVAENGSCNTMAGLLGYICPDLMPRLRDAVCDSLQHTKYLLEPSLELTFVPAFFSMLGLSLNYPFWTLFTPERCQILVNKANEYEGSCRLIEKFVRFLQGKID